MSVGKGLKHGVGGCDEVPWPAVKSKIDSSEQQTALPVAPKRSSIDFTIGQKSKGW